MTPKERAEKFHTRFYYTLPNNGYTDDGLLSIKNRWIEGCECAIAAVNLMKETLDEGESLFGVDLNLEYWDEVKEELLKRLEKAKNENNK